VSGIFDFLSSPPGQAATAQAVVAASSGDYASAVAALGRVGVQEVTFRTQISPPITVSPFAETPERGPPNPLLAFLKPQVEIETPGGVMVLAPYGTPAVWSPTPTWQPPGYEDYRRGERGAYGGQPQRTAWGTPIYG